MTALRFIGVLCLAIWVGGLAALGLAAPILFGTLEGLDPVAGRELAGAAFGAIFRRFQPVAWICGGVLLAVFGARAALGPRPRAFAPRVWILLAMLAVSIVTAAAIVPGIDRLRRAAAGPVASLPDGHPTKAAFNRLHGLSNGLMLLTLGGGLVLLWFETADSR